MFENKNIKRLLFGFLGMLIVYINLSNPDSVVWSISHDVFLFLPLLFLCILLWVLFSDKLIRAGISSIGLYWAYDCFLACLYRVDKDLAALLNTKYAYILTLVIGAILFSFYLWISKKK